MPTPLALSPYLQETVQPNYNGKSYSGTYKTAASRSRVAEEREYARMLSQALEEQGQRPAQRMPGHRRAPVLAGGGAGAARARRGSAPRQPRGGGGSQQRQAAIVDSVDAAWKPKSSRPPTMAPVDEAAETEFLRREAAALERADTEAAKRAIIEDELVSKAREAQALSAARAAAREQAKRDEMRDSAQRTLVARLVKSEKHAEWLQRQLQRASAQLAQVRSRLATTASERDAALDAAQISAEEADGLRVELDRMREELIRANGGYLPPRVMESYTAPRPSASATTRSSEPLSRGFDIPPSPGLGGGLGGLGGLGGGGGYSEGSFVDAGPWRDLDEPTLAPQLQPAASPDQPRVLHASEASQYARASTSAAAAAEEASPLPTPPATAAAAAEDESPARHRKPPALPGAGPTPTHRKPPPPPPAAAASPPATALPPAEASEDADDASKVSTKISKTSDGNFQVKLAKPSAATPPPAEPAAEAEPPAAPEPEAQAAEPDPQADALLSPPTAEGEFSFEDMVKAGGGAPPSASPPPTAEGEFSFQDMKAAAVPEAEAKASMHAPVMFKKKKKTATNPFG